ncbi:MAG: UDP-N-acetylglucosamine 1-carboxyvinyltransferase [Candidatus Dadabacteria bacterium]|nr:MAG: UDP-N-acetylglucosamine 1-carboxyvinyltransferase [Candidatus Dadabacteria bacterium]
MEISGGRELSGEILASGAKNAALPVLCATLLCSEPVKITNVPNLEDVNLCLRLLDTFGAETGFNNGIVEVSVPSLKAAEASYSLVKALRASFWVLAPLLSRGGAARVALPGGDIIGARPVDMHLEALGKMGAEIKVKNGVVFATAASGLKGAEINFRFPSVGATHQVLMAASLARGTTLLKGAAREPEVVALADFINAAGGDIEGAGSDTIVIRGKEELAGANFSLIGDRIEAATYLLAAAASGGCVTVAGVNPLHLRPLPDILLQAGCDIAVGRDKITISSQRRLKPLKVTTAPYPGFATDMQALLMAALTIADGVSVIEETVFEGRFGHVAELCRMGANISVRDQVATITGVECLSAAPVEALDIRAGAALVIAALAAEGTSRIYEIQHLRRGYERLEEKFSSLGALIGKRLSDPEDYLLTGC